MAGPVSTPSISQPSDLPDFEASLRPHLYDRNSSPGSAGWHFPGPSSKYHQRERATSNQSSRPKALLTSIAPVLSTEKRAAHRRVRSYHDARRIVLSPPSSDNGSGYGRSPLSRFASYTRDAMNANGGATLADPPETPAKSPRVRSSSLLQDSPFSDYFSSDARSLPQDPAVITSLNPEDGDAKQTQSLLVRLSKLQSQLMRGENGAEALYIVERKVNEVENELVALHSQTRLPMEDSGLFMDGAEDVPREVSPTGKHWVPALPFTGTHGVMDSPPASPTPDSKHVEATDALDHSEVEEDSEGAHDGRKGLLRDAREVLKAVTAAQNQLRQRHQDMKELNEVHAMQIEEREQQLEELRSENESLRSDMGFDHSELLFLKLQLKALEVEVAGEDDDDESKPTSQTVINRKRRDTLLEGMDRWRSDWTNVDARFRHRRNKYGIAEKARRDSSVESNFEATKDEQGQWRIGTIRKDSGRRVQSITICRTVSGRIDKIVHDGLAEERSVELGAERQSSTVPGYSEHATQTDETRVSTVWEDMSTRPNDESLFEDDEEVDEDTLPHDDDCAITTSSEADADEHETHTPKSTGDAQPLFRTAWQELWEGMADLVGMNDDRFD